MKRLLLHLGLCGGTDPGSNKAFDPGYDSLTLFAIRESRIANRQPH